MTKEIFSAEVLKAEKSLYHIAKSILTNDEDCADAMQNAILHAYEKLHTLRKEAYFKTWLTRILINECYQIIRSKKPLVSYEDYFETHTQTQEDTDTDVFSAIMELEKNYRIPFVLFYVEGFSNQPYAGHFPGGGENAAFQGAESCKRKFDRRVW